MDRPNVRNFFVQMDDGQMDRLFYVNLDRPNGRGSNGPPMLRLFGPSKWMTVQWTVVHLDGPLNRLYYGNLDRHLGPSKNMIVDRNFGPSKITVVDRLGQSKITLGDGFFDVQNYCLGL